MIQPRSYNTTYFRPKQRCNAILVEVVCLSTIGDKLMKLPPKFCPNQGKMEGGFIYARQYS